VLCPGNKLCKFADDTYLIIPASNVDSWSAEFNNIETWARKNNLTLNRSKSKEIVFIDRKRKRETAPPPEMTGIVRVTSLKILGVTVTNKLSASDHAVITSSTTAQSHCIRCESYVPVVCATLPSKPFIDQSSTPSYCTHPVLGGMVGLHQCNR